MSSSEEKTITVIGSGLIGRSWAMVFISGGYRVKIYDNQPGHAARAIQEVRKQLEDLQEECMLRGDRSASEQLALLSSHNDLCQALEGAFFVQVNPPYYVRLVELVPHPETLAGVMDTTHALMTAVGQAPVRLKKEIDGFALNRVQYAIIAESWRLVKDGVISVKDIDLVMSEGLGMRYAFIGPMETMHLNAPEGLEDYLQRYREGMKRVLNNFGPVPEFSGEAAERINKEMCELIPADQQHLSARRERRDQLLMGLAKLKK
ncbi:lambda-crystallin homolog isoform X2 [Oncorhynchus mykiss]|uniref:lambda-crystallin homolog isoform X2 n=1 Tax=Oncorhynchus mykiss TaxID=8022 RepID=UPI000B4E86B2|nr:lambda-crystallin homolog isoform X2 [Oncorhynchus mykiss]